jgi:phosphoglycolate phosphatase-like HAD superfamily hydrolase
MNGMKQTIVLFDVDGTLVDTAGSGRFAFQAAFLEVFGIDAVMKAESRVRFAGMTDPLIIEALADAGGIDRSDLESKNGSLLDSFYRHLEVETERLHGSSQVLPGVEPLLERLAAMDHAYTGLITGNLETGARIKLAPFDLNRFFPTGGFGSDHADRSQVARIAADKMKRHHGIDVPAHRVMVIGDTEHDITCARANGFGAVAVQHNWVSRDRLLAAKPDAYLPDLTDIPAVLTALGL